MPLNLWKEGQEKKKEQKKEKAKNLRQQKQEAKAADKVGAKRAKRDAKPKEKKKKKTEKTDESPVVMPDLLEHPGFTIDGKYYTPNKVFGSANLDAGLKVVQWLGKPYNKFYSGTIVKVDRNKDGWAYVRFDEDNAQLKCALDNVQYMKMWAFLEKQEESQGDSVEEDVAEEDVATVTGDAAA